MINKRFRVITPAGNIYTDSATEASEYKTMYGYPYGRNPDYKEKCQDNEDSEDNCENDYED